MPGFLVQVGATATCPHGGQVSIISADAQVLLDGQPAATVDDQFPIAGCPFTLPGPVPSPCVEVGWLVVSSRVTVNGQPVVLADSSGSCVNAEQAPQGPVVVVSTQTSVTGM